MKLYNKNIGEGHPTFVIAEIGLNHNGSVDMAKQLIDSAVDAGCDCVKFQKRDVDSLAIHDVLDATDERFPTFGNTYRAVREHIELSESQYKDIISYCKEKQISFLCTAFDIPSFSFLKHIGGADVVKLASHSMTNIPLLEHVAQSQTTTIFSTGMATQDEVDLAVEIFRKYDCPVSMLHCVSSYPTPDNEVNLSLITQYRQMYDFPIGYSGHEMGHHATLGSVFLGADIVERHITLDTQLEGFDHKLSLDPDMLKKMVDDVRRVEQMIGNGKKELLEVEKITRDKYHVSLVAATDIAKGETIEPSMITYKNPGTGIESYHAHVFVGKTAMRDIRADALLEWNHIGTKPHILSVTHDYEEQNQ